MEYIDATSYKLYVSAGIVVGVVLGVLGPSVGLITWLAWTYQYRRAKWTIAQAVGMHLTLEDISEDVPVASQPQQPNGTIPSSQLSWLTYQGLPCCCQLSGRLSVTFGKHWSVRCT